MITCAETDAVLAYNYKPITMMPSHHFSGFFPLWALAIFSPK